VLLINPRISLVMVIGLATVLAVVFAARPSQGLQASAQVNSFELTSVFEVADATGGENVSAEIVAATRDGKTLIYTDAVAGRVGFVDISDPEDPQPAGSLEPPLGGEPTSVAVTPDGKWALVAVHNDGDGYLWVIDLGDFQTEDTVGLTGDDPYGFAQPDSVAVSPDGRYAAIAIENERDEDVDEGAMPQAPAGFLAIVDLVGAPGGWDARFVGLTGIADRFPGDPEPEFVDINPLNQAAVTLQENNHIVIVNLRNGRVVRDFSAGNSIHRADLDDDDVVVFDDWLNARREPDGIQWTSAGMLATANEGDYDLDADFVGGRDFAIFNTWGWVIAQPFSSMERAIEAAGLYNDGRSDAKGVEAEGMEIGKYGTKHFMFVGGERCKCVVVYELKWGFWSELVQVLDINDEDTDGERPEGLLAIPQRGLFVSANEGDGGDPPGTISIFRGVTGAPPLQQFSAD
jgi:hypothetical protein